LSQNDVVIILFDHCNSPTFIFNVTHFISFDFMWIILLRRNNLSTENLGVFEFDFGIIKDVIVVIDVFDDLNRLLVA